MKLLFLLLLLPICGCVENRLTEMNPEDPGDTGQKHKIEIHGDTTIVRGSFTVGPDQTPVIIILPDSIEYSISAQEVTPK